MILVNVEHGNLLWRALLRLLERHYNAFLISKRHNNALLCLFRVITPFRKALHVKRLLNIFSVRNLILIGFRRYLFRNWFSILIEITHVTAEWCPINSRHPWVESCVIYLHKSTLRSPACYDIFFLDFHDEIKIWIASMRFSFIRFTRTTNIFSKINYKIISRTTWICKVHEHVFYI